MGQYNYINALMIKTLVETNGRQCDQGFLDELNRIVFEKILESCRIFSGYPEKLDSAAAKRLFLSKTNS